MRARTKVLILVAIPATLLLAAWAGGVLLWAITCSV